MSSLNDLLYLEHLVEHRARHRAISWLGSFFAALILVLIGGYLLDATETIFPLVPALMALLLGLLGKLFLMEAYFHVRIREVGISRFWAARIARHSGTDCVAALIRRPEGISLFERAGISRSEVLEHLQERSRAPILGVRTVTPSATVSFRALVEELAKSDAQLGVLLHHAAVSPEVLGDVADRVVFEEEERIRRERWWEPEFLQKVPVLVRESAHGNTPLVDRFCVLASTDHVFASRDRVSADLLETALADMCGRRAVLLREAEPGLGRELLTLFLRRHHAGVMHPDLTRRRVVLFDGNKLLAHSKSPSLCEERLLALLHEAARSGRVIFVFPDLAGFMKAAEMYGVKSRAIVREFFADPMLPIIAIAPRDYDLDDFEGRAKEIELASRV